MLHVSYVGNPLYEYLMQETLKPGEFGILAEHRVRNIALRSPGAPAIVHRCHQ